MTGSGGDAFPIGDNPVDSVDNSVCPPARPRPEQVTPEPRPGATDAGSGPPAGATGADLARAALDAAKQAARARGRTPSRRTGGAAHGGRRRTGWSGARADDRDPQQLGRLASRMATQRGWAQNLSGGAVFGRWAELVGAEVAEHAEPVSLRDGELTVRASSTAWATQLRLLQRQLLGRIAAGVGRGVVTKLRIQGPAAPSWRRGNRHVSGRGPRDTYG